MIWFLNIALESIYLNIVLKCYGILMHTEKTKGNLETSQKFGFTLNWYVALCYIGLLLASNSFYDTSDKIGIAIE